MNNIFQITLNGNRFRWDAKTDFRAMRAFLMMGATIEKCFLSRLVDKLDEVREMPEGQTMFIICSDYDLCTGKTLDELNKRAELLCKHISEGLLSDRYAPHCAGFGIKRTAKSFLYIPLEAV